MTALMALEERDAPAGGMFEACVVSAMSTLTERVKQLTAHCNLILVNDSLRDWYSSQADKGSVVVDTNAVSGMCNHSMCVDPRGYSLCGCRKGE